MFMLSDEQEAFRLSIHKVIELFGGVRIAREYALGNEQPWQECVEKLVSLGCFAINIPERYGGLGLGSFDCIPLFEEVGRALLPGVFVETLGIAVPLLTHFGTEKQKEKYLKEIAQGKCMATLAWLEPNNDFTQHGITTNIKRNSSHIVVDGTKTMIPCDGAHLIFVLGRLDGEIGVVLIDTREIRLEQQILHTFEPTRKVARIHFDKLIVPEESLLGDRTWGPELIQEILLPANAALSAVMVGGMEKVVNMATEYALIRKQFGQPIGRFQAIKHRIADMKVSLETAKSLSYYANWALDHNSDDKILAVYSARSYITDAFIKIASENIQIHGGIGFTEEADCHLFLKRSRYYEGYLGKTTGYRDKIASLLG